MRRSNLSVIATLLSDGREGDAFLVDELEEPWRLRRDLLYDFRLSDGRNLRGVVDRNKLNRSVVKRTSDCYSTYFRHEPDYLPVDLLFAT